jgi:hypothetical protein
MGSRVGRPSSLVRSAPSRSEMALAEVNSFIAECQQFCNIDDRLASVAVLVGDGCESCDEFPAERSRFDLGKSPQYPRTVARTWRYGCDSDARVHAPGLASETNEAYVPRLLPEGHGLRVRRAQAQPSLRSNSRGQGQADFPAQQPASCTCARLPAADAYARGSGHRVGPAQQGPPLSHCVILRGLEQV